MCYQAILILCNLLTVVYGAETVKLGMTSVLLAFTQRFPPLTLVDPQVTLLGFKPSGTIATYNTYNPTTLVVPTPDRVWSTVVATYTPQPTKTVTFLEPLDLQGLTTTSIRTTTTTSITTVIVSSPCPTSPSPPPPPAGPGPPGGWPSGPPVNWSRARSLDVSAAYGQTLEWRLGEEFFAYGPIDTTRNTWLIARRYPTGIGYTDLGASASFNIRFVTLGSFPSAGPETPNIPWIRMQSIYDRPATPDKPHRVETSANEFVLAYGPVNAWTGTFPLMICKLNVGPAKLCGFGEIADYRRV